MTLLTLPGVTAVEANGNHTELLTNDAEAVLRLLLERDPALSDVTVTGAGIEQAFLTLTRESMKEAS